MVILIAVLVALAVVGLVGVGTLTWRRKSALGRAEPGEVDGLPLGAPAPERADSSPEPAEEPRLEPEVAKPAAKPRGAESGLGGRLSKTRLAFQRGLAGLVARRRFSAETWEELEETLLLADVGVSTTTSLVGELKARAESGELAVPTELLTALRERLIQIMSSGDRRLDAGEGAANVWLFVGVNGVGKTTTIGKVAAWQRKLGRSVILAAGDTFRAAAADQLASWAERVGVEIVRGSEGGDPAAVVFDAAQRAAARGIELVLADTAGRLHTKSNLMEELAKVRRVASREPARLREVLLVLDATTGQNGLVQARSFAQAAGVTGVVLTKMDGTAKGGVAIAVQAELGVPVKLVGVGESIEDLVPFDPAEFIEAILGGVAEEALA